MGEFDETTRKWKLKIIKPREQIIELYQMWRIYSLLHVAEEKEKFVSRIPLRKELEQVIVTNQDRKKQKQKQGFF